MKIDDIINELNILMSIPEGANSTYIPTPIIVTSQDRPGLSAIKTANAIIAKKQELGLTTGVNEDGTPNYDDVIIREIVKQVFKAIQEEAKFTIAIPPGVSVVANGGNAGGPIVVYGQTTSFARGGGIIQ